MRKRDLTKTLVLNLDNKLELLLKKEEKEISQPKTKEKNRTREKRWKFL